MKRAAWLVLLVACNSPSSRQTAKEEVPLQQPADPNQWGPYAYDPAWADQKWVYLTEVEFSPTHRLEECMREFAPTLLELPDTAMFVSEKLSIRNPYGDAFHAHLGDRVFVAKDGKLEIEPAEGVLVLVTTPYTVDESAIVPSYTLSIRLRAADEALLARQPFVTVAKTKEEGTPIYVAGQPHNEGEAIFGVYDPSKTQHALVKNAAFAHGEAVLLPRFVIDASDEGRVWQRVGTYPYPPDLPADAAGTQFAHLEVAKDAVPVRIAWPGRPVVTVPSKPVATKADLFTVFHGVAGECEYVTGWGYLAKQPVMKVERRAVAERTAATVVEVGEETTAFFVSRLVSKWRETGGFLPPCQEAKAAVYEVPKDRPVIRSNANVFVKQIRFLGKGGKSEPVTVAPGSMASDVARNLAGRGSDVVNETVPAALNEKGGVTTASSTSTGGTSSNVTNVYIHVTHDNPFGAIGSPFGGGGGQFVGATGPTWQGTTRSPYQGYDQSQYRALWDQHAGRPDPNASYYVDPRTGYAYRVPTHQGMTAEQMRQYYASQSGVDPFFQTLGYTGYMATKKRRGW